MGAITEGDYIPVGEDFDADVAAAFDDLRADADTTSSTMELRVFRVPIDDKGQPTPNSKYLINLFSTPLDAQTLEQLMERVRTEFIRKDETRICIRVVAVKPGTRGVKMNKIFFVERRNDIPKPENSSGVAGDIASLMGVMQRQTDAQNQRMEAFMQRMMDMQLQLAQAKNAAPAVDPMAATSAMMQNVVAMMAVLRNAGGMMGAPAAVAAPDPMEQLFKLARLAPQLGKIFTGGAEPEDSGLGGLVKALAPAIGPALQLMAQGRGEQAPRQLPAPARKPQRPATAPANPTAAVNAEVQTEVSSLVREAMHEPQSPTVQETAQMDELKKLLDGLCDQAAADPEGRNIPAVVEEVMSEIPEEWDDQLFNLVNSPTTFALQIGMVCPRTREFASWFEQLRVEVLQAYEADNEAGSEPNA